MKNVQLLLTLILAASLLITGCIGQATDTDDDGAASGDVILTLTGPTGTSQTFTLSDLEAMTSIEGDGGFMTSTGSIIGPDTYTGVVLTDLLERVDGFSESYSIKITATDGYAMTYTYDLISNSGTTTYDPQTGNEIENTGTLTTILAYEKNGESLGNDGPLRIALLSSEGLVTDGHYWVKWVKDIVIQEAVQDWSLYLNGTVTETMDMSTFVSGAGCHNSDWVDDEGQVWSGIPLWLLVGRVDDANVHESGAFNRTLAASGNYTVKVIAEDGYSRTLNSTTVAENNDIIVACYLNDAPLPEKYWPLRLAGNDVIGQDQIRNIAEIRLVFIGGSG